jgi:hypothetical protein
MKPACRKYILVRFNDIVAQRKLLKRHDIGKIFGKDRRIKHAYRRSV